MHNLVSSVSCMIATQVRSEIFRYRARMGKYRDKYFSSRRLAHAMSVITTGVVKSECQVSGLQA
jgi:hypothetical protein